MREFAPALFGGFVFGFSPYLICKLLGDIDLALVPMLPLAVYLTLRALDGTMRRRTFIVLLALVLSRAIFNFHRDLRDDDDERRDRDCDRASR